ncbi:hypothetical protein BGX23_009296 [Mortierella sp. AD031]|nr:hypothetical protein BGX23_009296 [Mortierella sp. AD031]KAG0201070.1 hypothetical protein BGX33_010532 [Mortierella sp. NVP41]
MNIWIIYMRRDQSACQHCGSPEMARYLLKLSLSLVQAEEALLLEVLDRVQQFQDIHALMILGKEWI